MVRLLPALLLAASAAAAPVTVPQYAGLQLRQTRLDNLTPDLRVEPGMLWAAYGIRVDAPGDFLKPTAKLSLGARYVVLGPIRNEYLVQVTGLTGSAVTLDVRPRADPAAPAQRARFRVASYRVDGVELKPSYPELRLFDDGSYRMGSASGAWLTDEDGRLGLSGYYGGWGMADFTAGGLAFRFTRGGHRFDIALTRLEGVAPALARR